MEISFEVLVHDYNCHMNKVERRGERGGEIEMYLSNL